MASDARTRAASKYNANNTKQVGLRFNIHTDADIIEKLEHVDNTAAYIKKLIRADIANDAGHKWTHKDGYMTDGTHKMVYGEFGRDTWGLYIDVDGHERVLKVYGALHADNSGKTIEEQADELIAKLESGWRPVNW